MTRNSRSHSLPAAAITAVGGFMLAVGVLLAQGREIAWEAYAGNAASQRYSPAADITAANVASLSPAWTWTVPDAASTASHAVPGRFENTPLMIGGVLYVTTPFGRLAALDAETGVERWLYDPKGIDLGPTSLGVGFVHRGVAAWRDGTKLRLFLGSRHRLIAVDAASGQPVPTFGESGIVDLGQGSHRPFNRLHIELTSPPVVYKDLVIVGSAIGDRLMYANDPPGEVRAFDARSGRPVWSFHLVPRPGEPGVETWERDSWATTGHANVWTSMTVDESRGLLFLPVSTPSNDYYGGRRPGANLFAESLVCLDAATGQRRWHFQTVHHGIWDYDLPAAPTLATITRDGRLVEVVAQVAKTGFTFMFERTTGQPIFPIEERPVPSSDVPGERAFPTQPFPTAPPPFTEQGVSLEDAFDLTPALKTQAQEAMKRFRLGPLFTPPSLEGTLARPTNVGGANWGGAALDPERGRLFVHATNGVSVFRVARFDRTTSTNPDASFVDAEWVTSAFTKDGVGSATFSNGLPLVKPPYARVTAIDLSAGTILWQVPFGSGSDTIRKHPALAGLTLPTRLGTPSNAGVIATQGGLVFGGGGDAALYALDADTGRELWHGPTAVPVSGTPMSYRIASGRQFVVVATGGGSRAALVAFALAQPERTAPSQGATR